MNKLLTNIFFKICTLCHMNTYINDWLHYNHADDDGQSDDEAHGDSYYDNNCSDLIILL